MTKKEKIIFIFGLACFVLALILLLAPLVTK
jgi:flagellar biogenesis protein FliO